MSKLEAFIAENFNNETLDRQIGEQYNLISRAKYEIDRLNELKTSQNQKPWYEWDSVKFGIQGYSHNNGYCSHRYDPLYLGNYYEFVVEVLREIHPEVKRLCGYDHCDFIIFSPNQEDCNLNYEEVKTLPLIKEYFERSELQKKMKQLERQIQRVEHDITSLNNEISQTDKYMPSFIQELVTKRNEFQQELQGLQEQMNNGEEANRLRVLDELLFDVDRLIKRE